MVEPRQIIIGARVADIEDIWEERLRNIGQVSGFAVLKRPLNLQRSDLLHDELHFLPGSDSEKPTRPRFLYDINYAGGFTKGEPREILHEVYTAPLVDGMWHDTVSIKLVARSR